MYRNSLSTCQFVYIVSVSTRAEFIAEIIIIETHAACHFSMPIYRFHPLAISLPLSVILFHPAQYHTYTQSHVHSYISFQLTVLLCKFYY